MGLCGVYLMLFPLQKVHILAWLRFGLIGAFRLAYKIFALPGFIVLLFYIAFDVVYVIGKLESGTAHWAHLGGFISGVAMAMVLLMTRSAPHGANLLSLVLGRYAWPLIGRPARVTG